MLNSSIPAVPVSMLPSTKKCLVILNVWNEMSKLISLVGLNLINIFEQKINLLNIVWSYIVIVNVNVM